MKTKKADLVVKIVLAVIAVVLVGLLAAWMMGVFKDKKEDLNNATGKIDNGISSVEDFDLLVYDGKTVGGETLLELIDEYDNEQLPISVGVATLDGTTVYYNYAFTAATSTLGAVVTVTPPASKSTAGYITPSANFEGEIIKNSNDEIVCLLFTQQR